MSVSRWESSFHVHTSKQAQHCSGLTLVNGSLDGTPHILSDLAEEVPEEAGQQRAPQIQALVGIVIPVILVPPSQGHLR